MGCDAAIAARILKDLHERKDIEGRVAGQWYFLLDCYVDWIGDMLRWTSITRTT